MRIGWNSRLDTLQAAILKVKFRAFREYELEEVNRVADTYRKELMGVVKIPVVREGFYSSWAQYTLQLSSKNERDQVQEALKEKGIPTMVYYPKPMHQQVAFSGNKMYVKCPNTEKLCDTVLSLPIHPYLSHSDIQEIAVAVKLATNKKN